MLFGKRPDKDVALSQLNETPITNYELWLCLINDVREISGEDVDSIAKNYISDRVASVSELYKDRLPKPNPVLRRSRFSYDLSPEDIGRIDSPHYHDIYALGGAMAIENIVEYNDELGKTTQRFIIAPFGKEYADAITKLFKNGILPFLAEDEIILASGEKYESPKIVDKRMLEFETGKKEMYGTLTNLFRPVARRSI